MEAFPHYYSVKAVAQDEGPVSLTGSGLPEISSAPPAQFGGPGDKWSPEDLLVSSVADCFILTFRAIAKASRVEWSELQCSAEGVLDRVERVNRFTAFTVRATLTVPAGTDADKAKNLLQKAEASCLITNSLNAEMHLEAEVLVGG